MPLVICFPKCFHNKERQGVLTEFNQPVEDDHEEDKEEQDQPDQAEIIAAQPHSHLSLVEVNRLDFVIDLTFLD